MGYKQEFIKFMLDSKALCFGSFMTKSGRISPYFINTGSYCRGSQIQQLGKYYASCINSNIGENFDLIYGPAYKGIPLAVTTASALYDHFSIDKGYCFNRKEAKDHGEGGSFVGMQIRDGARIVMVDDVVTAGTSLRESLTLIRAAAQVDIEGLIVSVDRMEKGKGDGTAIDEIAEELGIRIFPIVTLDDIIDAVWTNPIGEEYAIDENTYNAICLYREKYGVKKG